MPRKKNKIKIYGEDETFIERIGKIVEDLYYISETDAEIKPFEGGKAETVSAEEILKQTESVQPVEERDFEELFTRLTKMQEWFGDYETKAANKFSELKELLENNLRDIKVFKIGRIEIDIYIVGLDADNNLKGVRTKAVET